MPRPSMSSEKAASGGGFGVQEGKVECVDARFKIVQYQKGDGTKVTPFCALQLDVYQLDDEWDRMPGSEETGVVQKDLIVCWQDKKGGGFKFRPGTSERAGEESEDAGDEVDTEGPTLYCDDTSMPFADSDALIFMKSLESKGWSAAVNDLCWAPSYVGAKFQITSKAPADVCKRLGIKHQARDKEQPVWEVVDVHTKPYEKGGKAKGTAASGTQAAGKPNGKVKTEATDADEQDAPELNETAVAVLAAYAEANPGKTLTAKQLQTGLGPFMMQKYKGEDGKKLQMGEQTKVIGSVRNVDVLSAMAAHIGAEYDGKKGEVTFAGE
jgi:hypothetical protein